MRCRIQYRGAEPVTKATTRAANPKRRNLPFGWKYRLRTTSSRPPIHSQSGPALLAVPGLAIPTMKETKVPTAQHKNIVNILPTKPSHYELYARLPHPS